jgi:hypothetical protein
LQENERGKIRSSGTGEVDRAYSTLEGIGGRYRSIEVEAMLSPAHRANLRRSGLKLERLEKARKDCTHSGLRKWIEAVIEKQKQQLASGNNPQ